MPYAKKPLEIRGRAARERDIANEMRFEAEKLKGRKDRLAVIYLTITIIPVSILAATFLLFKRSGSAPTPPN